MAYQRWTQAERDFIRRNAGTMVDKQIAAELSRMVGRPISIHAVRRQRHRMGIMKQSGRGICKLRKENNIPLPQSEQLEHEVVVVPMIQGT